MPIGVRGGNRCFFAGEPLGPESDQVAGFLQTGFSASGRALFEGTLAKAGWGNQLDTHPFCGPLGDLHDWIPKLTPFRAVILLREGGE